MAGTEECRPNLRCWRRKAKETEAESAVLVAADLLDRGGVSPAGTGRRKPLPVVLALRQCKREV